MESFDASGETSVCGGGRAAPSPAHAGLPQLQVSAASKKARQAELSGRPPAGAGRLNAHGHAGHVWLAGTGPQRGQPRQLVYKLAITGILRRPNA